MSSNSTRISLLVLIVGLFLAIPAYAQDNPAAVQVQLPESLGGTGWNASAAIKTLSGEQLNALPDADLLAEYGLSKLHVARYSNGKAHLFAESFEFNFPSGAYGYWTSTRGQLQSNRHEIVSGRYLISIMSEDPLSWSEIESAFSQAFSSANVSRLSPLVAHLPAEGKSAGSDRYIVGRIGLSKFNGLTDLSPLIDFSDGAEVVVAEYPNSVTLAIIEFHTPQAATVGYSAIQPTASDTRIVKRTGNYVVVANGFSNREFAQALVDKVKYTVQIHWEGKKFTSIPIDFRPPDPAALEEAAETATVLLRTFYGIGVLLLGAIIIGVFSGWVVFYWRRYQRRRMGLANVFSDAGGTLRLNLDDYLLEENRTKLIGSGEI